MANIVTELLYLGTTLTTELAERGGANLIKNVKTVVLDLTKQKSYCKKLRSVFCPNAKEPKIEVTHNFQGDGYRSVSYRFKDGNIPLSGAGITQKENGAVDFNLNIVDSATQVEHISASGSYNPNVKFFDWNNCGETLEHRFGITSASIDSNGFSFRASVNDKSALSVLNQIKSFFSNPILKLT